VLAASLGALAASVASALGRPQAAHAATTYVEAGGETYTTSVTYLANDTNPTTVLRVVSSADGNAVNGVSDLAPGVLGESQTSTGVFGSSTPTQIAPSPKAKTGVYGHADQSGSTGVWGESSATDGTGVQGQSRVGVFGSSSTAGWMGVWGRHLDAGYGVAGDSVKYIGVSGTSSAADQPGTVGKSEGNSTGLLGFSGGSAATLPAAKANTGVYGRADQAGSTGVWGAAGGTTGAGAGVKGESNSPDGIGVSGTGNNGGTGVKGDGRVGVFASSTTDGWMGIWGRHFGAGYGVAGDSLSLIGVSGTSNATNQPATVGKSQGNSTGLLGFSGASNAALPTARAKTGVFGMATQDSSARGVVGVSTNGQGVRGEASGGAALYGTVSSTGGYAIRGSGRVRFDKVSGVATIAANATSVTVTPGTDVTTESFVLLTAKANIGSRSLYFSTDTTANTITIRMSSSRTSSTPISWLLLS
jgi:hypothetical protein